MSQPWLMEGKYGPQSGSPMSARMDKDGSLAVVKSHGRHFEPTSRGDVFWVANQTGASSAAGLSATSPALTLYNPPGSEVNASIVFAGVEFLATFAAAAVVWVAVGTNPIAAAVTGTATTAHRKGRLGNQAQPKIRLLLGADLPAAPVAICSLGVGLTGAITTAPRAQSMGRYFDGSLILGPGANLSIQTSTSNGDTYCTFAWEEIPILSERE